MEKINRFGVIVEPFKAEVHEQPVPAIRPDEVLIKMEACNICSGDYTQYIGLRNHQGFPHAGGHEWVGRVIEAGSSVVSVKPGDRVASLSDRPCCECNQCMTGNFMECERNVQYTIGEDGYYGDKFFATYAVAKPNKLIKMPESLSAGEAAMLEPLSTCVQCSKQAQIKPTDDVVVVGAGTMGLLNAQTAHAFGARVIITEMMPNKLERARSMGFAEVIDVSSQDPVKAVKELTNGKGADAVIFCTANDKAYAQGYSLLKQLRGRMVFFPAGFPEPVFTIKPNEIHYRMLSIIGAYGATMQDYLDAVTFMDHKKVDVSYSMEGKAFPLAQFDDAMKYAAEPGRYRVTVDLSE